MPATLMPTNQQETVLLALLVVYVLVNLRALLALLSSLTEGYTSGAGLRYLTYRDDTGATNSHLRSGFAGYEAPVFWEPPMMSAVSQKELNSMAAGKKGGDTLEGMTAEGKVAKLSPY